MELLEVPMELLEVSRNHFKTNQEPFVNEKLGGSAPGGQRPWPGASGGAEPPGKKSAFCHTGIAM